MDGTLKKRGFALLCCVIMWSASFCAAASAEVLSTAEGAGGADCVYVAGSPDSYPLEYYDSSAGCYKGILPELLERISLRTGLNFTYINAGAEDQRLRLAENGQVELVSCCMWDKDELADYGLKAGGTVLIVPRNGQKKDIYFAFTDVADSSLISAVEEALSEITEAEVAGMALGYVMESGGAYNRGRLMTAALILTAAALTVILILAVQRHRYKKAAESVRYGDIVADFGNKQYFTERFERDIPECYRGAYSVIFIGFDIVWVNRYYGEKEAEEQLAFAEEELLKLSEDNGFAARVSGGGFAVARISGSAEEAGKWTREVLLRLNRYCKKYGNNYHPYFRAGIYMLRPSDRDCEAVLHNARQGYQLAAREGAEYAVFNREMASRETEKRLLNKQTLEAINNREFRVFLQFIVNVADDAIIGAEALSRWEHPQKGLLFPDSYIGLMESEQTIAELDFYIFEEVCKELEKWEREGIDLSLSCNFTRNAIDQSSFVTRLNTVAERYRFERRKLIIEITEDTMEGNRQTAFENIYRCREAGFRIALDDMGSGYTSFGDLRDYPVDVAKIDKSILDAAVNPKGVALLEGMISLLRGLNIEVMCEGVETEEQVRLLRSMGCDNMQGYYFFRLLPQAEAERVLRQRGLT